MLRRLLAVSTVPHAPPLRTRATQVRAGTRRPFWASRVVPAVFLLIGLIIFAGTPSAQASGHLESLTPAYGSPGTAVTALGAGFGCSHVTVEWDYGVTLAGADVGARGSFSANFTVPEGAAPGDHTVSAGCTGMPQLPGETFTVLTLTLSPVSGRPGDSITASFAGCGVARVQWDATGYFAPNHDESLSSFIVPRDAAPGVYTVTGQCYAPEYSVTATFTVLPPPTPELTLSLVSGYAGDGITAQGAGFECSQAYGEAAAVVQWDDGTTLANPTVQTGGSFSASFTVPEGAAPGDHTVTARCSGTESAAATADFTVLSAPLVEPTLTLSTASGTPGTRVTAKGSGFDCATDGIGRRGPIEVLWDDAGLAAASADDAGGFSVEFTVPTSSAEGTHNVMARCADGAADETAVATFSVRPGRHSPMLNLAPDTGEARTTIVANGQRYPRTCVTFAMRLDGKVLPLRVRAISADAATGTVAVTSEFDVPESASAGIRTANLDCTTRDGKLLASAAAAFTVAAAGSSLPPGVMALLAVLIIAAVLALLHARHVRGQRAWVREHVQVRPRQQATDISVEEPSTKRSRAVRLTAHLDGGTQDSKEVAP